MVSFTVPGEPIPQGSLRAINLPGLKYSTLVSDNRRTKPWKKFVAECAWVARQEAHAVMLKKPAAVAIEINFYFLRPKSNRDPHKTQKPDGDKLQRAVWDALTGVLYEDDSQLVRWGGGKFFGEPARAEITVSEVP